jgi:hypothetical protein
VQQLASPPPAGGGDERRHKRGDGSLFLFIVPASGPLLFFHRHRERERERERERRERLYSVFNGVVVLI